MRSLRVLLVLVAACGLVAMATVASAAVMQNNTIQTAQFSSLPSGTNLVQNGAGYVASSTWTADADQPQSFGMAASGMTDGSLPTANHPAIGEIMALDGADGTNGAIPYSIYFFDTAAHTAGYDVNEIDTYAGWSYKRVWQNIEVKYNLVGESYTSGELNHSLGSFLYQPSVSQTWYNTLMSLTSDNGAMLSGISALEIKYANNGFSGSSSAPYFYNMTAYTQLAMIGSPTALAPEPSSLVLLVCGLLGFAAYAWRKQR